MCDVLAIRIFNKVIVIFVSNADIVFRNVVIFVIFGVYFIIVYFFLFDCYFIIVYKIIMFGFYMFFFWFFRNICDIVWYFIFFFEVFKLFLFMVFFFLKWLLFLVLDMINFLFIFLYRFILFWRFDVLWVFWVLVIRLEKVDGFRFREFEVFSFLLSELCLLLEFWVDLCIFLLFGMCFWLWFIMVCIWLGFGVMVMG